ncbi:MAG: RrF2 family transcriptional regulator [Candidatus Zixiibacteriota bacterium]
MKFSTRARYGLRMMVELSRALEKKELVHLGQVARITGLSVNYLTQLAIPLKNNGLIIGVSGKKGGYKLGKPAAEISIQEILEAVQGPTELTDCVTNPDICLNSSFCEARMIWVIASHEMAGIFKKYTLSDLINKKFKADMRQRYPEVVFLNPDKIMAEGSYPQSCPAGKNR